MSAPTITALLYCKAYVMVNEESCVEMGCSICMDRCPKKASVLAPQENGKVHVLSNKKCLGCLSCIGVCPAGAISVVCQSNLNKKSLLPESSTPSGGAPQGYRCPGVLNDLSWS